MVANPVGCHLSDLPFKDANDWSQLHRFLGQICDAPHEHDHTRTFMLHLAAQNRNVLFSMTATLIDAAESEPAIVLTGRQVDANLAGLLTAHENAVAEPSTDEDNGPGEFPTLRSVSHSGSIYGDDDDNRRGSDVSSLTMATLNTPSSASVSSCCTLRRPERRDLSDLVDCAHTSSSAASTYSEVSEMCSFAPTEHGDRTTIAAAPASRANGSPRSPPFRGGANPLMLAWLRIDDLVLCGTLLTTPLHNNATSREMVFSVRDDARVTEHAGDVLRAPPGHGCAKFRFVRAVGENYLRVHVCPLDDRATGVKLCDFVALAPGGGGGGDDDDDDDDGVGAERSDSGCAVGGCGGDGRGVLATGVLEVDEQGRLVRWIVSPIPEQLDTTELGEEPSVTRSSQQGCAHLAGLSGLPFDRLWLSLPTEIIQYWDSVSNTPRVEEHGDTFLVKGSAVSDAALEDARAAVRAYLELKAKVRARRDESASDGGADAVVCGHLLACARAHMNDIHALREFKHGVRERQLSIELLGFGLRGVRSVTFERQCARLRLLLIARTDDGSWLQRLGVDTLAAVIAFLVPWRVHLRSGGGRSLKKGADGAA